MKTIVAHRGAPHCAHENTLESFMAAVSLGADMVELDIRRCGDGTLVVFHDPWLDRATRSAPVSQLSFDAVNKRAGKKGFAVPTMEAAFKTLSGKIQLDIELKELGYEDRVVACARDHFDDTQFVLTSFDPRVIVAVKTIDATLQTGFIMATPEGLALAASSPAEVLAPSKQLFSANREIFARAKKRGKKIAVWTVDGKVLLTKLLRDPLVDAIITNRPDRALALRKKNTDK